MTDNITLSGPSGLNGRGRGTAPVYGAAASDYFRAGWQPLPLPPGAKASPPRGYTGEDGQLIGSIQTVTQWARNPRSAAGNLGLRLLHPFVGIDVDTHGEGEAAKVGATTLAAAETDLGPLPPTLISSARPDPLMSGIRIFRLPAGASRLTPDAERALRDRYGPDIDVISQAYRYVVAWPSRNPDALVDGVPQPYRWYVQHGDGSIGHPLAGVPALGEVAELPQAWADLLAPPDGRARRPQSVDGAVEGLTGGTARDAPVDPFDPAQADFVHELDGLDVELADSGVRLYSRERVETEIGDRLYTVRMARRGQINSMLRDATSFLWHFVPHFLTRQQAVDLLIDAQRDAWVRSGGRDDGDYSGAMQTINHTVSTYVPTQSRYGQWWVAVPDDEDDEADGEGVRGVRTGADQGKYEGVDQDYEGVDPTDFEEFEGSTPGPRSTGSSSAGSPGATPTGTASAGGDGGDAADVAEMLALRERRRAEKLAKVEAERLAEMLSVERLRRQARAMVDEEEARRPADPDRKARLLADFLSSAQLDEIEPLEPLIEGWLFKGTLAQIFGPSGHYKSFVAADMMRAVATGERWHGHEVSKGRVAYICAEGVQGFRARIRAMESARNLGRLDNVSIVRRAIQIGGPEWAEFVEIIAEGDYAMIVVDTQARTTVGRKENDNSDMGEVVRALDDLIEATGVGVLMIHHSGKAEAQDGRGASAIKGALQSQIRVTKRDGLTVEIKASKQKDHEELGPYFLQLEPFGDSLVISANRVVDGMAPDRRAEREEQARQLARQVDANDVASMDTRPAVARVLAAVFGGGNGATKAEVRTAYDGFLAEAGKPKIKPQTFGSAWTKLTKDGHLLPHPKYSRWVLSAEGCKAFGVPFERPGWVTKEEWEEAIERGEIDPSVVLGAASALDPSATLAARTATLADDPDDDADDVEAFE